MATATLPALLPAPPAARPRVRRFVWLAPLVTLPVTAAMFLLAGPATAAPTAPVAPTAPIAPVVDGGGLDISIGGDNPSSAVTLVMANTVLSIAPSALLLVT